MRSSFLATLLFTILSVSVALPAVTLPGELHFTSEHFPDETALHDVPEASTGDTDVMVDSKTTLGRLLLYTSRVVGAERVQLTLEALHISVTATEEGPNSLSTRVKRDTTTNTNTNTNNVNVNTPSDQPNKDEGLSKEAKIGIGVGVPAAVFALIGLFIACYKK